MPKLRPLSAAEVTRLLDDFPVLAHRSVENARCKSVKLGP
jgi:hypothetical protein